MTVSIVFETHSTSEDNEAGVATGWHQGRLSRVGKQRAALLGDRRRDDGLDAVFSSDLRRAWETAAIAMGDTDVPLFFDWRLRECNYGDHNGQPSAVVHADRSANVDIAHPNGESWTTAVARVKQALDDIAVRYDGKRVLVIGHVATRWALEHYAGGRSLHDLATENFAWQEGWEFTL